MTHQNKEKTTLISYWNENKMAYAAFAILIPLLTYSIISKAWQTNIIFGAALTLLIGGSIYNVKQANKRLK